MKFRRSHGQEFGSVLPNLIVYSSLPILSAKIALYARSYTILFWPYDSAAIHEFST